MQTYDQQPTVRTSRRKKHYFHYECENAQKKAARLVDAPGVLGKKRCMFAAHRWKLSLPVVMHVERPRSNGFPKWSVASEKKNTAPHSERCRQKMNLGSSQPTEGEQVTPSYLSSRLHSSRCSFLYFDILSLILHEQVSQIKYVAKSTKKRDFLFKLRISVVRFSCCVFWSVKLPFADSFLLAVGYTVEKKSN